ncbi:GntR family transcriptional regulator [Streptomyces sp. NPDC001743]|uniref:GntR family transcriptional regulator n=1 Tax=Streptomyces sp. NPDC001743 TaxID=3154397 RepID=UPI003320EA8F
MSLFSLRRPADPAVVRTPAAMLAADLAALRPVTGRRTDWPAEAVERAFHRVYASTQPWLSLARTRRDTTDSAADRARWDVWIAALTPPEQSVRGTYDQACVLVGQGREMLRALRETLAPCPSVGSVAREIERLIRAGALKPGARVPRRSLARRLRVPAGYVDLALKDLAARKLVEIRASGSAVVLDAGARVSAPGLQRGPAIDETAAGAA